MTGGVEGGLGFAEDPSRFSLACRAVGPVSVPPGMPAKETVAFSCGVTVFQGV